MKVDFSKMEFPEEILRIAKELGVDPFEIRRKLDEGHDGSCLLVELAGPNRDAMKFYLFLQLWFIVCSNNDPWAGGVSIEFGAALASQASKMLVEMFEEMTKHCTFKFVDLRGTAIDPMKFRKGKMGEC